MIAVISAVSDWLAFLAAYGLGAPPLVAQGVARIIGGGLSFGMNRHVSFGFLKGHGLSREARRFLVLYAASYLFSILGFFTFLNILGAPVVVAKLLADGTCFFFNFIGMRYYVFVARRGLSDHLTHRFERFEKSPE